MFLDYFCAYDSIVIGLFLVDVFVYGLVFGNCLFEVMVNDVVVNGWYETGLYCFVQAIVKAKICVMQRVLVVSAFMFCLCKYWDRRGLFVWMFFVFV